MNEVAPRAGVFAMLQDRPGRVGFVQSEQGDRRDGLAARGRSWNGFWAAAAEVALPDHTVTALSALLEDVDAPQGARVEMTQCLEVLRSAAFDWDQAQRHVPTASEPARSAAT